MQGTQHHETQVQPARERQTAKGEGREACEKEVGQATNIWAWSREPSPVSLVSWTHLSACTDWRTYILLVGGQLLTGTLLVRAKALLAFEMAIYRAVNV
eukprot:scaffold182469_cov20-Tisochrysis_lutea.AAC.1